MGHEHTGAAIASGNARLCRAATRVAIVDDHGLIVAGLAVIIARYPDLAFVGASHDGHAVLDLMRRTRPDVLVLDLLLPGRDGVAVARDVQRQHPEVAILVLSGSAVEGLRETLLAAGVRGCLPKTASEAEFVAAVRAVAAGIVVRLPAVAALPEPLTARETEVLLLVAGGADNAAIAGALGIARRTVDTHLTHIFAKTASRNRGDLALYALRHGFVPPLAQAQG